MIQLYAKILVRGKGNKYRKVLSTESPVYKPIAELIVSSCQYTPGAILDDGEWFKISAFSSTEYSLDLTKREYETVDYDSLRKDEYLHIDYLFASIDGNLYFQNISKVKLARKKQIWEIGEGYRYVDDAAVITINDYPDAIYISEEDTLYFRRIEPITGIFKDISKLYREATEPEVAEFLQNDFIVLSDGFSSSDVKTANRKRIALAMDTLSKLHPQERQQIFSYIRDYCPQIVKEGNKFSVSSEENLKMVLFGIEQRFYTTIVGGEKRLANSVITI